MTEIVNLNRARKKKRAAEMLKTAEQNRAKFGRTKAEKQKEKADRDQRRSKLDAHQIKDAD